MIKKRDYKEEYANRSQEAKDARVTRAQARRKVGLKLGDKREVDHKNPLSKGGSNRITNLRVVKRSTNRKKGAK